jgi:O-antigen/teichoic acid export membrane protein
VGTLGSILLGFILPPFLIRRIGVEQMALWTIAAVVVDYCWLVDFGFRSATLKLSAEFQAQGNTHKANILLNTGLLYNVAAACVAGAITVGLAPWIAPLLSIKDPAFPTLLRIVGMSWALGLVFNVFTAFLESWQKFGVTSRIFLFTSVLRSALIMILVSRKYGLIEMGWGLLGSAAVGWVLTYTAFRRTAPAMVIAPRQASWKMLKEMLAYGIHAFVAQIAQRTANSVPPVMIVRLIGETSVTYFMTPLRILEYGFDAISRISSVSLPRTAELAAQGRRGELLTMALAVNRYGLILFLPMALTLLLWGREFMTVWINADFASRTAVFFPFVLAGYILLAGQWNSVSLLFGLGKHRFYSRCFVAECILTAALYLLVVPRYGLLGAGIISGAMLGINRGIVPGWLLARALGLQPGWFLFRCYGPPLAVAGISGVILQFMKQAGYLPGRSWTELILAAGSGLVLIFGLSWWTCVLPAHRMKLQTAVGAEWKRRLSHS